MNKITAAIQKLMNAMRGATPEQIAKTRAWYAPGVPFVVTDANRDEWKGKSGKPARGLLVDSKGAYSPQWAVRFDSFDFMASRIAMANDGIDAGKRFVEANARSIRNRPRLKAMLEAT